MLTYMTACTQMDQEEQARAAAAAATAAAPGGVAQPAADSTASMTAAQRQLAHFQAIAAGALPAAPAGNNAAVLHPPGDNNV